MKSAREFLAKHGLPALVVLGLVACALAFFTHYWANPAKTQAVGALFGFLAAAILIGVTWEYVRINQKNLALLQLQWEQQNRVVLRFGVKRYKGKAQLWVANLGKTDFLVSELLVRMKYNQKIAKNERRVVKSRSRETRSLPEKLWEGNALLLAFDVRLRYESQNDSGLTEARAFTLSTDLHSQVYKVRRGIDGLWGVKCPMCGVSGMEMITDGLGNFDDAAKRQQTMESDLRASCPDHRSQWMETVQHIRDVQEKQKEKETPEDD